MGGEQISLRHQALGASQRLLRRSGNAAFTDNLHGS